jgi:cytochrome c-type biogenesis protein CcmH/NrfG
MSDDRPDPDVGDAPGTLADERDFLLRSLDDLDDELLAGNIDPDTYRVLHDDYTARASAVIRSIADGAPRSSADEARVPVAMRVLTVGGIVVFAVLAAILLAHAVGQRRPGQQITGDAQTAGSPTTVSAASAVASAKAAASAQPKSYDARIRYARALLSAGVYSAAVQEYIVAARLDASQPEPFAYTGWLTALFARNETKPATRNGLLDAAEKSLDRAITVDPTYPDSYVFKGLLFSQIENKQCAAVTAFQQFLVTAPTDHPMRQQVLSALAGAVKAGKCPNPTTTPTTKP